MSEKDSKNNTADISISTSEALGKPVPKWQTFVTKTASAIGLVFSVATVAMGVYGMTKGTKDVSNTFKGDNEILDVAKKITRTSGVLTTVGGTLIGIGSLTAINAANSADKNRNYQELLGKLNSVDGVVIRS